MTTIVVVNIFLKAERKLFYIIQHKIELKKNYSYSMEAHAVHYNQKYGDFKEAADKHDGLAVVAFFLQATDNHENKCFEKLSEAVKDIVKINSVTTVPSGIEVFLLIMLFETFIFSF